MTVAGLLVQAECNPRKAQGVQETVGLGGGLPVSRSLTHLQAARFFQPVTLDLGRETLGQSALSYLSCSVGSCESFSTDGIEWDQNGLHEESTLDKS